MPMTFAAVLALAASCQSSVAPATIAKIAWVESSFDPTRTHINRDRSVDVGLMQINSKNFRWLGLTDADALDPCKSIKAGAEVLTAYSRYNTGSPTRGLGYAETVRAANPAADAGLPMPPPPPPVQVIYVRPSHGHRSLVYRGE